MFNRFSFVPWVCNPPVNRAIVAVVCLLFGMLLIPMILGKLLSAFIDLIQASLCATQLSVIVMLPIAFFLWRGTSLSTFSELFGTGKFSFRIIIAIFFVFFIALLSVATVTSLWQEGLDGLGIVYCKKQIALELATKMTGWDLFSFTLTVCILVPIAEEFLFRRLIYSLLLTSGFATAFWGTSLLFSVMHNFLAGIPGLLVLGVAFQFIYIYTRNWWSAVLLHSLVNFTTLAAILV